MSVVCAVSSEHLMCSGIAYVCCVDNGSYTYNFFVSVYFVL